MKKFLTLFAMPFLAVILVAIKVPEIDTYLKNQNEHAGLYIGILIGACTVLTHIITVISPFKKYERIEKNKWAMMGLITSNFSDNYFKKNKLSANVMVTKRCFFNKREPKSNGGNKFNFFQKMFKIVWTYDNKPVDKRLALTVKQGATGMALAYGRPVLIDIKKDGHGELNLNEEQKKAIPNMEFIISCPIFALDERYNTFSSTIIGMVNVSCSVSSGRNLIEKQEDRITLTDKVMDFSKICSLII